MDKPVVRDAALLIFRVVLGIIFVAHGWEKLFISGITQTTGQFSAWGVPQPTLSVWITVLDDVVSKALCESPLESGIEVSDNSSILVAVCAYCLV